MDGGRVVDLAMLAVGSLAIILAALLFGVLPERPEPTRQFVATFNTEPADAGAQDLALTEGEAREATFTVVAGNVSFLEITVAFTDDLAASDPDRVILEVLDPNGTVRPPSIDTSNLLPQVRVGSAPPAYDGIERVLTIVIAVNDQPSKQVVTAADDREDADAASQRMAPLLSAGGAGVWTIRASIVPGDCPAPELDPQRAAACHGAAPGGQDPGNVVSIVQFRSFHWSASFVPA